MSRFTLPAIVAAAALAVGCTGSGTYHTGGGIVTASAYTPDLVTVSPGVSVVAGYHEPVFYTDNYYWRPDNYGRWYRSSYYDRGWVYASPPRAVMTIERPYTYRNYRPHGYTVRRDPYYRGGRTYDRTYRGRPVIRDQRQYRPRY